MSANAQFLEYSRSLWDAPGQFFYPPEKFAHLKHLQTHTLILPKGPGAQVYSTRATARRVSGADAGFPFRSGLDPFHEDYEEPENVPQELISTFRNAFQDGLKLFYPDNLVLDNVREDLQEPAFGSHPNADGGIVSSMLVRLPRITAFPYKSVNNDSSQLRASLEHEMRRSFNGAKDLDMLESRHDRAHLSPAILHATYSFYEKNPELWAALYLIQSHLLDSFRDVYWQHKKMSGTQGHSAIQSFQDLPGSFILEFINNSIAIENIPLFFGAAAVSNAHNSKRDVTPELISDSIHKANQAGIFRIAFNTRFGDTKKVICPFASTGVRWFTMDVEPEETLISLALKKIYDERGQNKKLDQICRSISGTMRTLINESEPYLKSQLDTDHVTPPGLCPFHKNHHA